ncbi:MAG: hypothetical protein R6U04_08950 [Bacteroidales bacterium]
MKNLFWFTGIAVTLIISSCGTEEKEKKQDQKANEEKQVLTVNEVMQNPANYLDEKITVKGMVSHVCEHGGKRLHLSQTDSEEKLRVRAGKSIGKFPKELEGNTLTITGKFVEERMDEEYINRLRKGEINEASHDHHEGEEHENYAEHSEDENKEKSHAKGVSEDFIKEMEARLDSSEEGYISEYWLENIEMEEE